MEKQADNFLTAITQCYNTDEDSLCDSEEGAVLCESDTDSKRSSGKKKTQQDSNLVITRHKAVQSSMQDFIKSSKVINTNNYQPPKPHTRMRDRKIRQKKIDPPAGSKTSKAKTYNEPEAVNKLVFEFSQTRVIKYKKQRMTMTPEPFVNSAGVLFCQCCRECLSLHHGTIVQHTACPKHINNKKKLNDAKAAGQKILQQIDKYVAATNVVGFTTFAPREKMFRHDVLFSFLCSGDQLAGIDHHRKLFEKYGFGLTDATHLSDLIPLVQQNEFDLLDEEFKGLHVSVIFDAAAYDGECLGVLLRAVKNFQLLQRAVNVSMFVETFNNRNVAAELMYVLVNRMRIGMELVMGWQYDRASVNKAAIRTLIQVFTSSVGVPCISHTLSHVGERMQTPNLDDYVESFVGLMSKSEKAKLFWYRLTGTNFPRYASHRWWSIYEVYVDLVIAEEARDTFILDGYNGEFSDSKHMQKLYKCTFGAQDDTPQFIELELIAVVEMARPFVMATFFLEGDGFLMPYVMDILEYLEMFIANKLFPLTDEFIEKLVQDVAEENKEMKRLEFKKHGKKVSKKAFKYFAENLLAGDVGANIPLFKACRLANPAFVKQFFIDHGEQELQGLVRDLETSTKFVTPQMVELLLKELPTYTTLASQHAGNWSYVPEAPWASRADLHKVKRTTKEMKGLPVLNFWAEHASPLLNTWGGVVTHMATLNPSSAGVERLFALLRDKFDLSMKASLHDYMESSLLLRYNGRQLNMSLPDVDP